MPMISSPIYFYNYANYVADANPEIVVNDDGTTYMVNSGQSGSYIRLFSTPIDGTGQNDSSGLVSGWSSSSSIFNGDTLSATSNVFGGATISVAAQVSANYRYSLIIQDSSGGQIALVNGTLRSNEIEETAVARLSNGDTVLTWSEDLRDGSGLGIYQARFNVFGQMVGVESRASIPTTGDQANPEVTALLNGGYVVTYEDESVGHSRVVAVFYDAAGNATSGQINVSGGGTNNMRSPEITTLNNGRVVIAWQDDSAQNAYYRVYNANGSAATTRQLVSAPGAEDIEAGINVAALSDGGFALSWVQSAWNAVSSVYEGTVYAQSFNSSGAATSGAQMIAEYDTSSSPADINETAIIPLDDGGYGVMSPGMLGRYVGQPTEFSDYIIMDVAGELDAMGGNDNVIGSSGDDTIIGGDGNDVLRGMGGNDRIFLGSGQWGRAEGGDGDDLLNSDGVAILIGGAGNDVLVGGNSPSYGDELVGGIGDDALRGRGGGDTLIGGDGNDMLFGGTGDDDLIGGAGNDRMIGGTDDGSFRGGDGNDIMVGHRGEDTFIGGSGQDTINGRNGDDIMQGGGQRDYFVFTDLLPDLTLPPEVDQVLTYGHDVILDFQNGIDRIRLAATADYAGFGDLQISENGANALIELSEGSSILVMGAAGDLDASDFIFV